MTKTVTEQVLSLLQRSQAILVVLPQRPSVDALASALTLRAYLTGLGKKADIVSDRLQLPQKLEFMHGTADIMPAMPSVQKCVITINKKQYPVADVGYTVSDDMLRIFVTPKQGTLPAEAVQVHPSGFVYDLIVAVNVSELPAAGLVYENHKSLFQTVPIINVDHRPDNEQYGQVNWIDIKATSTAEMVYGLLHDRFALDAQASTNLLAGIMEETHSFRTPQVTPATLQTVSALLKSGANHALVTQNLYRNKTVGGLKLWGHVLTHLQADRQLSLAWSLIPASLFATTGTSVNQLQDLMLEILSHSPEARTVVLFIEHEHNQVEVQVTAKSPLHAKDLIKDWQPRGSERFAQANVSGKSLVDVEQEVIGVVKKRLQSVLGA